MADQRCHTITYGFELSKPPSSRERLNAKKTLQDLHGIDADELIIFFNGTLDYAPNLAAVDIILQEINPRLLNKKRLRYKIIICGKNLPAAYNELKSHANERIIYAGFVQDISAYFAGADLFINPVIGGGGIKTKLVEALGYDLSCVSTESGAIGVNDKITGQKLKIVPDADWESFTNAIFEMKTAAAIPEQFFQHFYWGNIAGKAAAILNPPLIANLQ